MQITLIKLPRIQPHGIVILLLRYAEKKQGSEMLRRTPTNFKVRSPAGSHLSKLVATPGSRHYFATY